ncbi:MAG: GHKL domain-containing protein [Proteobacteria bacterium]|nr:GHKL domain-containing protein [Pseudomonadota bacterium]
MKIQHKFSLVIFGVGTSLVVIISSIYYEGTRKNVIASTQHSSIDIITEYAHHVEEQLSKDAQLASTLANIPLIRRSLSESNLQFSRQPEEKRTQNIIQLNSKWKNINSDQDPFIQGYMNNPVASYLNHQQAAYPEHFGEIFLTNRYGVVIGTTKKLTTLAHSHKYWWIGAHNDGRGRIFFDDRGYDESVKGYVLGVVVPVMKGGEVIGILKCNTKILGPYSDRFDIFSAKNPGAMKLVRSGGLIIFEQGKEPLSSKISSPSLIEKLENWQTDSILTTLDGEDHIISYTPVAITQGTDKFGFGGSYKSIDHIKGNQGEGWFVIYSRSVQNTITSQENQIKVIFITGIIIIIFVALFAMLFGKQIAAPIVKFVNVTQGVTAGQFNFDFDYSAKDELGVLNHSFKNMVDNLRELTISRNNLIEEVNLQNTQLEERVKRRTLELQKTHEQLLHSEKLSAIGRLSASIAHEFNNPLFGVMSILEGLKKNVSMDDSQRELLKLAVSECERMKKLIRSLDDFNQPSSGKIANIDINETLESVLLLTNKLLEEKGIKLITNLDRQLPHIMATSDKIKQVFLNLIYNAQDACELMEEKKLIIATEKVDEKNIAVHFKDTGKGIDKKNQAHVFDPFFSTKSSRKGTGLGLSISYGIIKDHQGKLKFKSKVGHGTTFSIILPILRVIQ